MKACNSRRRVVLALCAAALSILIFALYAFSYSPIQSTFTKVIISTEPTFGERPREQQPKLKVYMYDLPRKFNFGLFNRTDGEQDIPWRNFENLPRPHRFGLKKQHSVEYWLTLDLLARRGAEADDDKVAVRVADPEQADVFFVPFFASLSFNVYGVSMRDPVTEHDRNLQVEILDFLRSSSWWQRSKGRDHILVLHHPNAFRFLKDQLNASVLVVSDFGRFPPTVARLEKDIVAPYSHMVPTFRNDNADDPFEERTTLLFFQGRIKRKADGIVRTELASILENHPKVHFEEGIATNRTVQEAMEGMRSSKFCLHPAGDTPSSCRLFDAIVSHCVPVIVSDRIELPYEDELDYTSFCLFVSATEATKPGYLMDLLETFPKDKWLAMWRRLKQVSGHFEYQQPSKKDDAVNMIWKQVLKKLPAINLALHRSRRLKIQDWWNCKRKR